MTRIRTIVAGAGVAAGGHAARRAGRRGVLLLIVLSLLTLFMMLGAAYLAAATRARTAAKAYAKLTFGADDARIPVAPLLDDVLLRVVRGPAPTTTTGIVAPPATGDFESLLEDKYGVSTTTLSGTVTGLTNTGTNPALTGTLTLAAANVRPTDLAGRVLTFVEPGHVATSHRIVRARTGANTNAPATTFEITLDRPFRADQAAPATGQQGRVVINGREFFGEIPADKNEPWDGFDADNKFLARVAASGTVSRSATVQRPSYGTTAQVDNDGDGVPDGQFFSWDLPSFTDAAGNTVRVDASVLVVDLDGRFNVNAHGSLAPTLYPDNHAGWIVSEPGVSAAALNDAPLGSGYGPADVQFNGGTGVSGTSPPKSDGSQAPSKVFDADPNERQPGENPRLSIIVGDNGSGTTSRQTGQRPSNSRFGEDAETPRLGRVDGKYGEKTASNIDLSTAFANQTLRIGGTFTTVPRPGEPNVDDDASRIGDRRALPTEAATVNRGVPPIWWPANPNFNWHTLPGQPDPRGVFNSPPDLHGRMKTLTIDATGQSIVPRLVYAKPEWDDASGTQGAESKDDPYELLIDTRRGVGGWSRDQASSASLRHNPFTLAELEPVLRPYDGDTSRQPQRLAAMLGTDAEAGRLLFTTESWDTTTITGSAALRIYGKPGSATGWLQTIPPANTTALSGTSPVTGLLSGELARGEKFDLNRAFDPSAPVNAGYAPAQPYFVQRQAYFKDLYTLLVALQSGSGGLPTGTNPEIAHDLAQWAANVVKFRDADSRIIPFEYEEDIKQNGWTVDSNVGGPSDPSFSTTRRVVWPAVRPEIVIREVFAWNNPDATSPSKSGMVISLHRPWKAEAHGRVSGSNVQATAEPCDYALDTLENGATGRPLNRIDLGKKADASVLGTNLAEYDNVAPAHYPIWRLRITDGAETRYVRFDTNTPGTDDIAIPGVTTGANKPKMDPDSTLTLYSGDTIAVGNAMTGTTEEPIGKTHGGQAVTVPGLQDVVPLIMSGTIYLERLSDPSVTLTKAGNAPGKVAESNDPPTGEMIWTDDAALGPEDRAEVPVRYVVVDAMPFEVTITAVPPADVQARVSRRATTDPSSAFWKTASAPLPPGALPAQVPDQLATGATAWFVWPNRPFISAAELLLVPQGNCETMLEEYARPDPENWAAVGLPLDDAAAMAPVRALLFDCVHVPTRFSGIHTTGNTSQPDDTGIHAITTPVKQFSAYREPGRVNLNTITSEQVWNAVVAGPLSAPIVSGSTAGLGIAQSSNKVVKTMLEALDLEAGGTDVALDKPEDFPQIDRNPAHAIYTATRLGNTVTTRSNVFAVWITLREYVGTSPNDDPDSVRYHRGFYIVDRSIPVGFEAGRDHNVWDCVRLRRVIE
jgi:hypothetical protein